MGYKRLTKGLLRGRKFFVACGEFARSVKIARAFEILRRTSREDAVGLLGFLVCVVVGVVLPSPERRLRPRFPLGRWGPEWPQCDPLPPLTHALRYYARTPNIVAYILRRGSPWATRSSWRGFGRTLIRFCGGYLLRMLPQPMIRARFQTEHMFKALGCWTEI